MSRKATYENLQPILGLHDDRGRKGQKSFSCSYGYE